MAQSVLNILVFSLNFFLFLNFFFFFYQYVFYTFFIVYLILGCVHYKKKNSVFYHNPTLSQHRVFCACILYSSLEAEDVLH